MGYGEKNKRGREIESGQGRPLGAGGTSEES